MPALIVLVLSATGLVYATGKTMEKAQPIILGSIALAGLVIWKHR